MPKISALPPAGTLADDDETPFVDDSVTTTKKFTLAGLLVWLQSKVGWITAAMLGDNQVTAVKLSTSALLLSRTIVNATITQSGTTETTIISTTITVPSGGRGVWLILTAPQILPNDATRTRIDFKEGSTVLTRYYHVCQASGETFYYFVPAPSAGSHTYTITSTRDSGAGTVQWYADNTGPALIQLVAMNV